MIPGATWASGGSLNTQRAGPGKGTQGTQTARLLWRPRPPSYDLVEQYNGSSWTEIAELNTARANTSTTGTNTLHLLLVDMLVHLQLFLVLKLGWIKLD